MLEWTAGKGFVIHVIVTRIWLWEQLIINSTLWHCRDWDKKLLPSRVACDTGSLVLTCPSFKFMSANRASHLLILSKHTHITRVPCPQAQKVMGSAKKISVSRLTDMEIVLPGICCLHTSLEVRSTQKFQCKHSGNWPGPIPKLRM